MEKSDSSVHFESLREVFERHGLSEAGVSPIDAPTTLPFYMDWLDKGYAGDMDYLRQHAEQKAEPEKLLPCARSVISVAVPYFPHPRPKEEMLKQARVALYAQGEDYHFWLKEQLQNLVEDLSGQYPGEEFRVFVDSAPVLERDYAQKAGLGWVGKNSCLINQQKGSLFFLAEIFTTLALTAESSTAADRCGTCTRCLDICPTGALREPRVLDANLCISYLTIESKSVPRLELREQMGDWFFGCDLCQTICPWNEKVWGEKLETSLVREHGSQRQDLIDELKEILQSSHKKLEKRFAGSALLRARPRGLKRNAVIVAARQQLVELVPEIEELLSSPLWQDPEWQELLTWALRQLPLDPADESL